MLLQMFYYETFYIFFNKLQTEELTKSNYKIIEMTANGCLKNDQHTGSRKKFGLHKLHFRTISKETSTNSS